MKETSLSEVTDEDRMIQRLQVHKNLITWMLQRLAEQGIKAKRTRGNDPGGDIVICDPNDVQRAQEIIRMIQREYNP